MNQIINFIKYHNLFTIILGLVLIATASAMANEDVRNAVIGEEIVTEQGIDNSQLLAADLDNFDLQMQIIDVTEDEKKYYVTYQFRTLAVIDNVWQPVIEQSTLTVYKDALGDSDLGLYVAEKLTQTANYTLNFLKEVQVAEKEKGISKLTSTVEYTGLIGLVLNVKEKVLPGYEPVIPEPEPEICDGTDNDRDGLIDEDLGQTTCGVGACQVTVDNCLNGALISCVPETPGEEVCDGIDNDCDGGIDEDNVCQPFYQPAAEVCDGIDNDRDGLIDEDLGQTTCGIGACQVTVDNCLGGVAQTCTPLTPAEEICDDGVDNNCDGKVDAEDEDCQAVPPGEAPPEPACDSGHLDLCETEANCLTAEGYWYNDQCNAEAETPPQEVCDAIHLNLCTTQAECETVAGFWYNEGCNAEPEAPAEPEEPVCNSEHLDLCTTQELCEGAGLYWYNEACNTEPEAPVCTPSEEICDGIDNDCDGEIDEDLTVYSGIDEGECQQGITECIDDQMVETQTEIGPTEEICDGLDNNCDGQVDEDLGQTSCGIGACEVTIENCLDGVLQTCTPGMPSDEICDGVDNNCDGQIDEGGVCETPEEPEE